jgi:hypothetical protein
MLAIGIALANGVVIAVLIELYAQIPSISISAHRGSFTSASGAICAWYSGSCGVRVDSNHRKSTIDFDQSRATRVAVTYALGFIAMKYAVRFNAQNGQFNAVLATGRAGIRHTLDQTIAQK